MKIADLIQRALPLTGSMLLAIGMGAGMSTIGWGSVKVATIAATMVRPLPALKADSNRSIRAYHYG